MLSGGQGNKLVPPLSHITCSSVRRSGQWVTTFDSIWKAQPYLGLISALSLPQTHGTSMRAAEGAAQLRQTTGQHSDGCKDGRPLIAPDHRSLIQRAPQGAWNDSCSEIASHRSAARRGRPAAGPHRPPAARTPRSAPSGTSRSPPCCATATAAPPPRPPAPPRAPLRCLHAHGLFQSMHSMHSMLQLWRRTTGAAGDASACLDCCRTRHARLSMA